MIVVIRESLAVWDLKSFSIQEDERALVVCKNLEKLDISYQIIFLEISYFPKVSAICICLCP